MTDRGTNPRFGTGRLVATPGALRAMAESGQTPDYFLQRHLRGDWGEVDAGDWKLNDQALADGSRILSVYSTLKGIPIWVITEAADDEGRCAATTILLPDEF